MYAPYVHLIFYFWLFFFFFGTGICKLEKVILSLQVTGGSNWFVRLLLEKRMQKENISFFKFHRVSFQLIRMVLLKKAAIFCVHLLTHTFDKFALGAYLVARLDSRG